MTTPSTQKTLEIFLMPGSQNICALQKLMPPRQQQLPNRGRRYLRSDGLFSSSASTVNEEAITILGVNTALLAQGDDIGKLAVGLRAWRTLGIQSRTRRNFTFLLSHHPLENVANQQWLCEREVDQGSQMTRSSDVSLSGHVHKADAQRVTSLDGASLRLVAGQCTMICLTLSKVFQFHKVTHTRCLRWWRQPRGWTLEVIPRIWSRTRP